MRGRAYVSTILLAAAVIGVVGSGGCGGHPKAERPVTVKVAILPEFSLPIMMERYAPLIARLQEAAGPRYRLEWVSCPSPEAYMATVESERPALGIQDAFHTSLLQKLQDAGPVLQAVDREGLPVTRGAMVVREGTQGIGPGDRIAVPSRRSFLFVSQTYASSEDRIIPAADARLIPLRWQDDVVDRVRDGTIAAGLVSEEAVGPGLRVVALTAPMPSACVVVFPRGKGTLASILCASLAQMSMDDPIDRPILERLGIRGFVPIDRASAVRIRSLADRYSIPY